MATIAHPRSGVEIEGTELQAGDTIQEGDLVAVYDGAWVEWPELIDHRLDKSKQMVWVRPKRS